jgi:hypothetical protein
MQDKNLPVKTDIQDNKLAAWVPEDLRAEFLVETTLPQETPEDRFRVLELLEGECFAGEDAIGSVIEVGDYIIHPVKMLDEPTGEYKDGLRTVLIQSEGPPIAFVAQSILAGISRLVYATKQVPPFRPPLRCMLKQQSRGKNRFYKLIPVTE